MSLVKRAQLLRGLLSGSVAPNGPFFVDVDLSQRCNLRCVGCTYHSPRLEHAATAAPADISPALFSRLCAELRQLGTETLVLQGAGEPFLHPDYFELVRSARAQRLETVVLTNGTQLDEERVARVLEAPVDALKLSLWASSAAQYQALSPGAGPDGLAGVLAGLRRLTAQKHAQGATRPLVYIHHPINQTNFESLDEMVQLAIDSGCDGITFTPFRTRRGALADQALSTPQTRQVEGLLERARRRLDRRRLDHNIDGVLARYRAGDEVWRATPCYIAWVHLRVRVDGSVQPCGTCDVTFGNLHQQSLREIWNGAEIRAWRRQMLSAEGVQQMDESCDCSYCCYLFDNLRVERIFRWFRPLRKIMGREAGDLP